MQILGKEDLPSLNETITIVRAEERRRGVMLETIATDSSTLAIVKNPSLDKQPRKDKKPSDSSKVNNKDSLWCTYCRKPHHTVGKCWKFHGKTPKNGEPRGQG